MSPLVVIIPVIIGIVILVIVIAWKMEKKRTEAWEAVAEELGLPFQGKENDVMGRYGHLKLFQQGHSRKATNAISGGSAEVRITIADYRYVTGHGRHRHTHKQTICVLESAQLDVSQCSLRPERKFFDAIGSMLGGQDFDFDEDPEFSNAYVLQGADESAVRMLFGPEVRAWFAARRGENLHFEAVGGTLVFHTGKNRPPSDARELMGLALDVMRVLTG